MSSDDGSGTAGDLPADWADLAAATFGAELAMARRYAELLVTAGIDWGLIGPREAGVIWPRHILNSAGLSGFVPWGQLVADVGSGAGLPGIPLALARPDLTVELVEPMRRRVDFLARAVADLGLDGRVRVIRARVEDYDGQPGSVVCRAVASVDHLIGLSGHLVPPARLLALKGQRADLELATAAASMRQANLVGRIEPARLSGVEVGRVVLIEAKRS